jgi:hypothetical protein
MTLCMYHRLGFLRKYSDYCIKFATPSLQQRLESDFDFGHIGKMYILI